MSVKFERDTIQQTGGVAAAMGSGALGDPTKGPLHELADEVGVALTGGQANVGTKGYLAVCDLFR